MTLIASQVPSFFQNVINSEQSGVIVSRDLLIDKHACVMQCRRVIGTQQIVDPKILKCTAFRQCTQKTLWPQKQCEVLFTNSLLRSRTVTLWFSMVCECFETVCECFL